MQTVLFTYFESPPTLSVPLENRGYEFCQTTQHEVALSLNRSFEYKKWNFVKAKINYICRANLSVESCSAD